MIALGNLEVGSKIKVANSFMGDTIFLVADQNHADYPSNSTTLITEKVVLNRAFDAKEPNNNYDGAIPGYGNGRYDVSNIKQFLNSTAGPGEWYTKPQVNQADEPPTNDYVQAGYNDYDQDAGFLNGFDSDFVNALLSTTVWSSNIDSTGGKGMISSTEKMFLPSRAELFGLSTNGWKDGSLLSLFSANTDDCRIAYASSFCISDSEYARVEGSATSYLTRTMYQDVRHKVQAVSHKGADHGVAAYDGFGVGIRPLCNLSAYTLVSDSTDGDGCYTLIFNDVTTFEDEVERLKRAKAALKASIEAKGVTVPEETRIDGYAALVDIIGV